MITVILKDGSETTLAEWQKIYVLPVGSSKIGKFFSLEDKKITQNLDEYKKLVINELLMRVLDRFREITNEPCILNSFNRSEEKQKELQNNKDYAAAKYSPHCVYMAADVKTKTEAETITKAKVMIKVGKELGIKIRVGYMQYLELPKQMTFIHVDVCPEYYGVGKPYYAKPHPLQWQTEMTW